MSINEFLAKKPSVSDILQYREMESQSIAKERKKQASQAGAHE